MRKGVFEVKSTDGDTHLGGEDFDIVLVEHLLNGFKMEPGIALKGDRTAIQRVCGAVEKAKIELLSTTQTEINLPFITADAPGPKHINPKLMRSPTGSKRKRAAGIKAMPATPVAGGGDDGGHGTVST